MDREREVISIIHNILRSGAMGDTFETDAQPFIIDGCRLLFTVDEFSSEDRFSENEPYCLASNLVVATLSDILAGGGVPLFFGHGMTIPPSWDEPFIREFSRGIRDTLSSAGTRFIGGDTGFGNSWKYSGIAIGKQAAPLTRRGAKPGDLIYISGKIGAGNVQAALSIFGPTSAAGALPEISRLSFHHRSDEAELIRKYASSCTDSSDGVLRALINISGCSLTGFRAENLPYIDEGLAMCENLNLDKILLSVGESGEYELVFTVPSQTEKEFLEDAKSKGLDFYRIGRITEEEEYILRDLKRVADFKDFNIYARDFKNVRDYLSALCEFIGNQK